MIEISISHIRYLIEKKKSITSSGVRVAGLKHRKIKEDAHVCDEIVISPFIPTVCFLLSSHCDILFVYRQKKSSLV